MTAHRAESVGITIVAIDPPFGAEQGILFGLQSKRDVEDPVPACRTTEFHTAIRIRAIRIRADRIRAADGSGTDFTGDHVQGRKGDRFLYLSWGVPDRAEPFVMFARAKIKLAHIPNELLDGLAGSGDGLICELQATNAKGQPASGTIKPPDVRWRRH